MNHTNANASNYVNEPSHVNKKSPYNWLATFLLCFFLGGLGAHRFYVGKVGTGLLMLFTFGGFGIWVFIDFIIIVIGNFRDKSGLYAKNH